MAGFIQNRYSPLVIAAASTVVVGNNAFTGIGGFLCYTAGALTVARSDGSIVINALACVAGTYISLPFSVGPNFTVTSGAGLTGVLALS